MPKLWIVHRRPQVRAALARATGLATAELAIGAPDPASFAAAAIPAAIVLGLDGDGELELEFARATRLRCRDARWIVIGRADDAARARRALGSDDVVIHESPPSVRRLRAEIGAALDARAASDSGTDAARRARARIGRRVEAWFGRDGVPGLERATRPRFAALPLLLRGRPGSGRVLLGHHAELERGDGGPTLRLDARALADPGELVGRLSTAAARAGAAIATVWLDEVDALPPAVQRALADWIALELPPAPIPPGACRAPLRWIATAGPRGAGDRLEPELARAFVPLTLDVPPLARTRDELARIADAIARDWAEGSGESLLRLTDGALAALAAEPLWGERAELEAILRATLAAARGDRVEATDLRFPDEPAADADPGATARPSPADPTAPLATPTRLTSPLPPPPAPPAPLPSAANLLSDLALDPDADPSSGLAGLSESWPVGPEGAEPFAAEADPPGDSVAERSPDPAWRRLARSLSHEIRNPLVSIRTFTELLPDHFADETFRARFKELVGKDVAHIQDVVTRLAKAAERDRLVSAPVDVSSLIDRLLAARRERIGRGRLVVLTELERDEPMARVDADALETALAGLIDRALDSLPERGDLFIATRRTPGAADRRPRLRVLLRHHDPQAAGIGGELDPVNHILEYVLAETIVEALGGRLTIDPTQGPETLIVIDLPTP